MLNDTTYFFEGPANVDRLRQVVSRWEDTPYRHFCQVRGLGCDCVHFLKAVMVEMGLCSDFQIPWYERDWPLHRHDGLVRSMIEKHINAKEIPVGAALMAGDILLYRWGRDASHAGIYLDESAWMSTRRHGVEAVDPGLSNWTRRHQTTFRAVCP